MYADPKYNQPITHADAILRQCCVMPGVCSGESCMAWRWIDVEFRRRTELWSKKLNQRVNSAFGDDADWRPVKGQPSESDVPEPRGMCGHLIKGQ